MQLTGWIGVDVLQYGTFYILVIICGEVTHIAQGADVFCEIKTNSKFCSKFVM